MATKLRTAYVCNECGAEHGKWQGQCAACEAWNCCYRSFASVASIVFILLRMFSSPASPGHHTVNVGQALKTSQRGTDWNPQWTGLSL